MEEMYFASKKPVETAAVLLKKAESWFQHLESNAYLDKLRQSWAAYYGTNYSSGTDGHQITFSGEQGEFASIVINHYHNLASHMLVMVTSTRPAMQARATNTDYKSLVQTNLANGLLDYYLREKRLEKYLKKAVECAIILGAGYIKLEWDATTGETYDFNEETQTPIYEGDVRFSNLSPFDVVVDSTKENDNHDWILCRSTKNRYDLAAKYPELRQKILSLPTISDISKYSFTSITHDTTDDIPLYEFYHRRSEAMPDGRYLLFLDSDVVLMDAPMPYRDLPIYRLTPGDILGSPYGYTPMFDILSIQDGINLMYSTVLTNQVAHGVQNVYVTRGSDITISQLAGGMNVIEGNPQTPPPTPLQLSATAPETFKFLELLERAAETISGVNSVARGNPESSLKSGNALALVQSMALQFISGLQQSYVQLVEDVGTGVINMLKDFASVPRIAAIVGKSNRTYMQEFTGDDLKNVNRVIVDVGNPLARTTAGRVQMAEQMLQMGLITRPEQYFQVINTGKLETMTDGINNELLLIKRENEMLVSGEDELQAVAIENHPLHINEHKSVLADPDLKKDAALVARTLSHIQEHIHLMRTVDPDLLKILNIQPLGPAGGSPANQPPQQPPTGAMGQMPPTMEQQNAQTLAATPEANGVMMPQPAQPPGEFQNMPTSPEQMITS